MSLPNRLKQVVDDVRARNRVRRRDGAALSLRDSVEPDASRRQRFVQALSGEPLAFIAECKRSSPSAGLISSEPDLAPRMRDYAASGAAVLSILTEPDHFGGELDDLRAAPEVGLPRLRKDFLLDVEAVWESWHAGADAVLLIARCLPGEALGELHAAARECGLGVLVEVHDEDELAAALPLEADALGVNARNLETFEIDLAVVERLLPLAASSSLRVAESGLACLADLQRIRAAGADAALVGSALMRATDPGAVLREWRAGLDAN